MEQIEKLETSIKKFSKEERKKKCADHFSTLLNNLYLPSPKVTFFTILALLLFYVAAYFLPSVCEEQNWFHGLFCTHSSGLMSFTCSDQNWLNRSDLIAAHAGIGAVVFALFIFIAESLRDSGTKENGRVLLKVSFLYPLVLAEVLVFLTLILFNFKTANFIAILIVAVGILISIYRVIEITLNNQKMLTKRIEFWKELIATQTHQSIENRIANNLFLSSLDGEKIKLKYNPFRGPRKDDTEILFYPDKTGKITDINLQELKEIGIFIDKEGNKNGFIFSSGELTPNDIQIKGIKDELPSELKPPEVNDERFLYFKFGDFTVKGVRPILSVSRSLLSDGADLNYIRTKINKSITIDEETKEDAATIRQETLWLRQEVFRLIQQDESESFKEHLKIYIGLAQGFIENLNRCGTDYDYNKAQQERTQIWDGWSELKWIRDDFLEIIGKVKLIFHDSIIWQAFVKTVFELVKLGIKYNDQLIYQEALSLLSNFIYNCQSNGKYQEARKLIEHLNFFLNYEFEDLLLEAAISHGTKNASKAFDFQKFPLFLVSSLFRTSVERKDYGSAKELLKLVKESFEKKWVHEEEDLYDSSYDEAENLDFKEDNLSVRILELKYGLCAWIHKKVTLDKDQAQNEQLKSIYFQLRKGLPDDVKQFTELYLHCDQGKVESFWQWSFWDIEVTTGVRWTTPRDMIKKYFVWRLTELFSVSKQVVISETQLIDLNKENRDIAYAGRSDSSQMKIVEEINAQATIPFIFNENIKNGVEKTKTYLKMLEEKWEKIKTEEKRNTSISDNKVLEFMNEFYEGFTSEIVMRNLFEHFGKLFKDFSTVSTANQVDKNQFGIIQVDDKAAFFDDWHVGYGRWGGSYGSSMARGEDKHLFESMTKGLTRSLVSEQQMNKKIQKFNYTEKSVIFMSRSLFRVVREFEGFRYLFNKNEAGELPRSQLIGMLHINSLKIPVYTVPSNEEALVIYDFGHKADLKILNPQLSNEITIKKEFNGFYYCVSEYSKNTPLLEQILNKPPKWLQEVGDRTKQQAHLMERVLVEIYEKIELEKITKDMGICLRLRKQAKNPKVELT